MDVACVECGRQFTPLRPRQRRCDRHEPAFAAAQASYRSPRHRRMRREAIADAGGKCAWCGSTDRLAFHHLDSKVAGGSDAYTLVICGADHSQYEADERHGRDTPLRRFVNAHRIGAM